MCVCFLRQVVHPGCIPPSETDSSADSDREWTRSDSGLKNKENTCCPLGLLVEKVFKKKIGMALNRPFLCKSTTFHLLDSLS